MTQNKDWNLPEAPASKKTTASKTLEEQQAQIQRMRSSKIYAGMRTEQGDYRIKLKPIIKVIKL